MAKQKTVAEGTMLRLDPSQILVGDGIRFGMQDVETLAQDIMDKGGVMQSIEVEPLQEPSNGHLYRLTAGGRRHAAVSLLNERDGAGLTLPAIVVTPSNPLDRIKRQVSENHQRSNMSPLDIATAAKRLLDSGAQRIDVRTIFARPVTTGKKGGKPQPASNAWLNIHLQFLDMPTKIQNLIHTGELTVGAAYTLARTPPEKWDAILEAAQRERARAIEKEQKEDDKYTDALKRTDEANAKAQVAEAEFAKVKEVADVDAAALETATAHTAELFTASKQKGLDAKAKKEADKAFVEAQKILKGLEGKAGASAKDLAKVTENRDKLVTAATEKAAKLTEAKATKPAAKVQTAVGRKDVEKAATSQGASAGNVALNAKEMRDVISELCLAGTAPKVLAIATAIRSCFQSEITPVKLYQELLKVTGEKGTKK